MEPMDKEEERIQQQMAETRASLTEKLETLEQKVVGTVEEATTAVSETVDVIKDSVQGTVTAVNETVKESVETVKDWFDVSAHVQEHPWLMVGGSVAAGYCLGTFLSRTSRDRAHSALPSYPWMRNNSTGEPREERPREERPTVGGTQTPIKSALSNWAPEIDKLKSLALGVLFGTAREMIASSVPEHVGDQLKEIFDSVTKKVGGEPIPSSDLAPRPQEPGIHDGGYEDRDEIEAQWQSQSGRGAVEATSKRW